MLLLIVIISFDILSKRFFLKREELSDARVVSITKNEHGFAEHFLMKIYRASKVDILRITKCNMLKLSFD